MIIPKIFFLEVQLICTFYTIVMVGKVNKPTIIILVSEQENKIIKIKLTSITGGVPIAIG